MFYGDCGVSDFKYTVLKSFQKKEKSGYAEDLRTA